MTDGFFRFSPHIIPRITYLTDLRERTSVLRVEQRPCNGSAPILNDSSIETQLVLWSLVGLAPTKTGPVSVLTRAGKALAQGWKKPGFLRKKTQPYGFFLAFFLFFCFFVFLYICPVERVFRVFQFQEYF
jgi:hypothetical protein